MKYKIKCPDGDIYTFKDGEELLEKLCNLLGDGHKYLFWGEWIEG